MWPWEHVVVAYLVYSLGRRAVTGSPPRDWEAVLVAFGAVLPDLIDKPLAWQFGVFPSGSALAHSVFFAVPLSVLVVIVAARRNQLDLGIAFAVGYLSHLPADVIPTYLRTGELPIWRVLWPVMDPPSTSAHGSFIAGVWNYYQGYLMNLTSGEPSLYVLVNLALTVFAITLWVIDGAPGLALAKRWIPRANQSE